MAMLKEKQPAPALGRVVVILLAVHGFAYAQHAYYPGTDGDWEHRAPEALGFDAKKLEQVVRFAQANEVDWLRDVHAQIEKDTAKEPYPQIQGETKERGGPAGLVVRNGYIAAEWGDIDRVDMSFSVAKSYLSTLAGIAFDRGLIKDLNDPLWKYVRDGGFDSPHNSQITWHMLLNQTSEWQGTLWGKPDVADRRRGYNRVLDVPGGFWEYNDVRVNRLALSLLRIWDKPLPQVLKEEVMDPIGASAKWVWHGYRNSYVELNGTAVQSVSGGSHWGGGLWASARDHARFGYLFLRWGQWHGRQIVSERWIKLAATPTDIAPHYGYLWWLNTGRKVVPSAPESSFFALGSGGNVIWIDREHDMVVVTRWLEVAKLDAFAQQVLSAMNH
jgi:CubicO group peptidase (beta-lactamase class C family)